MKKAYLIRKGVSLNQIKDLIDFIDNYKGGGIIKSAFAEEETSEPKELMNECDIALLFLGTESSNSEFEEEIAITNSLGLRRAVFTTDENAFPSFTPKGIPSMWKMHCSHTNKATESQILRAIRGAIKWGI